ncbi:endo alpha-1,4 polygalactosaminidase [Nitrosomonas communis]|uniref:Glycoside-hydrolase family GH114 TIM-barrel domain-containing protein n=1 Tax=Nitrosomonas communis TaxID=44574 RepID=A0A1I4UB85_9PROT|nr:endo alpha-1,4 polygalactosaminidase [Nitrosomonas communis]SFM86224.1 hypothetical protein SAMN05421863_106217 [Nitrosomonas communis]
MKKFNFILLFLLIVPVNLLAQIVNPFSTPSKPWQYQLQGTVNTSYDAAVYDIDLFDSPQSLIDDLHAKGIAVVCYFSAGSWENWREDADQFPENVLGRKNGWAGERWLDIRSNEVRSIMAARIGLARSKGCDAVEPDNVDGYSNKTGFPLTYQDQIDYNRFLAMAAHTLGLKVGLKNDLEQINDLIGDFDFAINEECHRYRECDVLKPFIDQGKAVFNVEYRTTKQDKVCAQSSALGLSTIFLPLELDDSFRFSCPPLE